MAEASGRLDDRRRRPPLPRRVQQRPVSSATAIRGSPRRSPARARRLNTNLRYLHESAIELAERLIATCPPGLDTVLFVNSGSEANDLAWRIATTATGGAAGCARTSPTTASPRRSPRSRPRTWPGGRARPTSRRGGRPTPLRGTDTRRLETSQAAIGELGARGTSPAGGDPRRRPDERRLTRLEPAFAGDWSGAAPRRRRAVDRRRGPGRPRPDRRRDVVVRAARASTPDFVTLGKPMGNGHPVGAVITRRELAEAFAPRPSSSARSAATRWRWPPRSRCSTSSTTSGSCRGRSRRRPALRAAVRDAVTAGHDAVGDVRGVGLANGSSVDAAREGADAAARAVKDGMRRARRARRHERAGTATC